MPRIPPQQTVIPAWRTAASVRKRSSYTRVVMIEPVAGKSTYSEFLERVPEGGVHHLGFSVEDYDAAAADLDARGYKLVQRGTFGDTKFGYYESSSNATVGHQPARSP